MGRVSVLQEKVWRGMVVRVVQEWNVLCVTEPHLNMGKMGNFMFCMF